MRKLGTENSCQVSVVLHERAHEIAVHLGRVTKAFCKILNLRLEVGTTPAMASFE
jgi:hypothetical protein